MELYQRDYLYEWEYENVGVSRKEESLNELAQRTHSFFVVEEEGVIIGLGGLIAPNMISDSAYVWFILRKQDYSIKAVSRGITLARNYLSSLPWTIFAEVAVGDKIAEAFAVAVGFHFIVDLEDRKLMKWGE